MTAPVFFPVWVSNHAGRRSPYCWGPPCALVGEALRLGRAEVDAGHATLAFVVEATPAGRRLLTGAVYPEGARKIVRHWEAVRGLAAPDA